MCGLCHARQVKVFLAGGKMQQLIKDFENYLIDEEGQIFSLLSHKFLKHNIKKDGYHEVSLYKDGEKDNKKSS